MKNLMIVLLFLPAFVSAQYGIKNCHTDLVFGYDYGTPIKVDKNTQSSQIQSFRFGTNLNYPTGRHFILTTGFRIASKRSSYEQNMETKDAHLFLKRNTNNFFAEIPFSFRRNVKRINREANFYVEAGIQFNFFIVGFNQATYEYSNGDFFETDKFERDDDVNNFHLSSQLAIGYEYKIQENIKFFIQPIGRFQLLPSRNDVYFLSYHFGLETGLRF